MTRLKHRTIIVAMTLALANLLSARGIAAAPAPDEEVAAASGEGEQKDVVLTAAPVLRLVNPAARDQDDLCFWRDDNDPARSTVIVSDKTAGRLFVYDLQGNLVQSVEVPKPGNIDTRSGFPFDGERVSLVLVNQRDDGHRLCVYRVEPSSRRLIRIDDGQQLTGPNYGGCLYHSRKSDRFYFVITSDESVAEQYELNDDGQQHVKATLVRSWPIGKCEGAVADDTEGKLYIAEEQTGVWQFDAEPGGSAERTLIIKVGEQGIVGDLEGIAVVAAPDNQTSLVFSDQGSSTFHVLPLDGSRRTRRFRIAGATETDGVDVMASPLGGQFASGLLGCHTDEEVCPILLTPFRSISSAFAAP